MHPYIESRQKDLEKGAYPKQHLWGCDALQNKGSWSASSISTNSIRIPKFIEKLMNRLFFRNSPGLKNEIAVWKASLSSDFIYSVCGPLSLIKYYPSVKVASWVFRAPKSKSNDFSNPYHPQNLSSHAGFFCLTPRAEKYFSQFAPSKFLPWCVDTELFDGEGPNQAIQNPFFLASGKTGRDYKTLVEAASKVNAELRIIGPASQKPNILPPNVNWIETSSDPPDQAIDYNTLREWYAQCIAVCIPLTGDSEDTCGYTTMLAGMAMRKPILMTQTGCLHIKPEMDGFGFEIKPFDTRGWIDAMNGLLNNKQNAQNVGNIGREIVEKQFSIDRFNSDLVDFIGEILYNK